MNKFISFCHWINHVFDGISQIWGQMSEYYYANTLWSWIVVWEEKNALSPGKSRDCVCLAVVVADDFESFIKC